LLASEQLRARALVQRARPLRCAYGSGQDQGLPLRSSGRLLRPPGPGAGWIPSLEVAHLL